MVCSPMLSISKLTSLNKKTINTVFKDRDVFFNSQKITHCLKIHVTAIIF